MVSVAVDGRTITVVPGALESGAEVGAVAVVAGLVEVTVATDVGTVVGAGAVENVTTVVVTPVVVGLADVPETVLGGAATVDEGIVVVLGAAVELVGFPLPPLMVNRGLALPESPKTTTM